MNIPQQTTVKKDKALHFEFMRLLAIFFVVHIHTGYDGYYLFSKYPDTSLPFWVYLFISIFGAFAVPLFFSVSGALMLNRPEEPLKKLWLKRIVRYGILLVAACFLYYVQSNGFVFAEINIKEFIIILYSYCAGSITWFLYSYLAYLVLLPVLSTLAKSLKNEHYLYLFAIALVYDGVIPMMEYAVFQGTQSLNSFFTVGWVTENIVLYPLLGYFLEHRLEEKHSRKWLGALWAANILTILLACAMTIYKGRITGAYLEGESSTFFKSFVLINCSAVYLTVSRFVKSIQLPKWLQNIVCSMGSCTLGIYLFHLIIMELPFGQIIRRAILSGGMNPMLASMLFCLCVMLLSYGVTFLLKKLPLIGKIL